MKELDSVRATRLPFVALALAVFSCDESQSTPGDGLAVDGDRSTLSLKLSLESCQWDGDSPNSVGHCQFLLANDSDSPVFVDVGLPEFVANWEQPSGAGWNRLDDFHLDERGGKIRHGYRLEFQPKYQPVTKQSPLVIRSSIRRCQCVGVPRFRVGVRFSTRSDGSAAGTVCSDEFTLDGK